MKTLAMGSRNRNWNRIVPGLLGLALLGLSLPPRSTVGQPPIDPEEAAENRIMAQRAVRENCLICHGEEMFQSQRLSPKQWQAEVEKMVGWGSPLPVELHPFVVAYLSEEYSERASAYVPGVMTIAAAVASLTPEAETHAGPEPSSERGGPLYVTNCANCHGNEGQGAELGPNLVEKPVLYRALDYRSVVREGLNRMPGFAALLKPEAEADILAWLRNRRYDPSTGR